MLLFRVECWALIRELGLTGVLNSFRAQLMVTPRSTIPGYMTRIRYHKYIYIYIHFISIKQCARTSSSGVNISSRPSACAGNEPITSAETSAHNFAYCLDCWHLGMDCCVQLVSPCLTSGISPSVQHLAIVSGLTFSLKWCSLMFSFSWDLRTLRSTSRVGETPKPTGGTLKEGGTQEVVQNTAQGNPPKSSNAIVSQSLLL